MYFFSTITFLVYITIELRKSRIRHFRETALKLCVTKKKLCVIKNVLCVIKDG